MAEKQHKIAYLCSSVSWGGLEMNQLRNALWMRERGHEVLVLCKSDSPISEACIAESLPQEPIGSHKKYYDFKAGKKLAAALDRHGVTHLIIRDTRDLSLSVIAKRKAKSTIHLSYFMEMQLGVRKTHLLHSIRFKGLDAWCCPLNWLADQVREMTHMDKTKIHVIPSGLDLSRFTHGIDQAEARKMLELPSDPIIVGLSGRFDPFKGQLLLLEAVQRLQMPDLCICFLGEPTKGSGSEYTDTLLSTIDAYGLGDKVFIRPFRKDIEVFYAAIDLFVMASKAETFGMVTIEAMASGVPVIASNSGGSPEILNFGKLGRLFAPLLAESLAEEIRAVCEGQHADKETLLAAARIYDHHRVCEMVEQTLRL